METKESLYGEDAARAGDGPLDSVDKHNAELKAKHPPSTQNPYEQQLSSDLARWKESQQQSEQNSSSEELSPREAALKARWEAKSPEEQARLMAEVEARAPRQEETGSDPLGPVTEAEIAATKQLQFELADQYPQFEAAAAEGMRKIFPDVKSVDHFFKNSGILEDQQLMVEGMRLLAKLGRRR